MSYYNSGEGEVEEGEHFRRRKKGESARVGLDCVYDLEICAFWSEWRIEVGFGQW